jgi:hypothetical protein
MVTRSGLARPIPLIPLPRLVHEADAGPPT